jgi:Domain of unknown function (DUF4271)
LKHNLLFAIFVLVLGLGTPNFLRADIEENPFELLYRKGLKPGTRVLDPKILANPFELIERPRAEYASLLSTSKAAPRKARKSFTFRLPKFDFGAKMTPMLLLQRISFGVVTFILLFLAFLATLLSGQLQKTFQAFFNDNLFAQLYREREARGPLSFWPPYAFFLVNVGIFIFFLTQRFGANFGGSLFGQLMLCIGGVIGLFLLKPVVLRIFAGIFPVEKEVNRYLFLMVVFASVLGLILAPVNIFLAYGPSHLQKTAIWGTLALVVAVYLYRSLRGALIANRYLALNKFHFLLYICTVEIAPILLVFKLITRLV